MRAPRPYTAESVDPTSVSPSGPRRAWKQLGLVLLCGAWIALGLTGHDPWKTEDAVTIGVTWEMAQRGDVVVPYLAHEPWLERPPLVPALAAATMWLASPPLAPHDAARLAAGLMLVAVLALTAYASRELNGRAFRWMPVLILVGSIGLWDRAHALSPDLGVMVGVAAALYGFALALRRPLAGGALIGLGATFAFLSRGHSGPEWIALTAAILPALGAPWRTRAYAATSVIALFVAAPLIAAWPLALYLRSPDLLSAWLAAEPLAEYLPVGEAGRIDPIYAVKNLLWFAWPALPLLVWTLWIRGRGFNGGLAEPGIKIPGVLALVMLAGLALRPDPTLIGFMPLLVPLALLAALEIDSLERGWSSALDWFGILTFGIVAVLLWALWIDARFYGMSLRVARFLDDVEIGYLPRFKLGAMLAALLLTGLWVVLVRPARRTNRRAVLNWAAGVTLVWGLATTIWLPYVDGRRSYRVVADTLRTQLPDEGCVASRNLGESQRALFYYFAGIVTAREEAADISRCDHLLIQYGRLDADPPAPEGWRAIWSGARRGDASERYVLYRRAAP